jgi:hypothetical protein
MQIIIRTLNDLEEPMQKKIHSEAFISNQATKSPGTSSDTHDYKHNIKT